MPNRRLAKTRASLPEGYQFGDARPADLDLEGAMFVGPDGRMWTVGKSVLVDTRDRHVIEGEQHE